MNKLKNIFYILGLSLMIILPGCSEPDDEITSIDYDRLFSVTELTARVVNRTGVRLAWNANKQAESYSIEVYSNESYEGTPVKSVDGVTEATSTITDLDGDTQYWARVKAVGADLTDSKWSEVSFKTEINSILLPVQIGDVTATDYIIRWPAGTSATKVVLTPTSGTAVTYTLTADDISKGIAKITGLRPSTAYTVVLYNGNQRVGLTTLTTLAEGTIFIYPEDDFESKISEGNIFLLMPGTYSIATLDITKSMTLQGASATDKPILKVLISLKAGVDFNLENVILDGSEAVAAGKKADQAIQFNTADVNYGDITITGCEIRNYLKGLLYFNVKAIAKSITINNCIIYNIECDGGDFFDCRKGTAKIINFTKNTVYNSASARDFFRIDNDNASALAPAVPKLLIDSNTFNNVTNNNTKRMLYIRWVGNEITFTNNILANTQGLYTDQAATKIVSLSKNNYFNAPNFTGSTRPNAQNDTGSNYTSLDPQFENAANGDFTVGNVMVTAGDPRWIK